MSDQKNDTDTDEAPGRRSLHPSSGDSRSNSDPTFENQNPDASKNKAKSWGRLSRRPSFMGEKHTIPVANITHPLPCTASVTVNFNSSLPEDRLIFRRGTKLYIVQESFQGDKMLLWGYFASDNERQGVIPKHYVEFDDPKKRLFAPQNTIHRHGSTFFTFPSSADSLTSTKLKKYLRSKSAEASLVSISSTDSHNESLSETPTTTTTTIEKSPVKSRKVVKQGENSKSTQGGPGQTKNQGVGEASANHNERDILQEIDSSQIQIPDESGDDDVDEDIDSPDVATAQKKRGFKLKSPFSSSSMRFSKKNIDDKKPRSSSDSSTNQSSSNPFVPEDGQDSETTNSTDSSSSSTLRSTFRFKSIFRGSPSNSGTSSPEPAEIGDSTDTDVIHNDNETSDSSTKYKTIEDLPPETVLARSNAFHQVSGELRFLKNDIIYILKQKVNQSPRIYLGYLNGAVNILPASKVDIISSTDTPTQEVTKNYKSWPKYEGIAPHISSSNDDLPFKKGDIIYIKDPQQGRPLWFAVMDTSISFSETSSSFRSKSNNKKSGSVVISGTIPSHLVRPYKKAKRFKLGLKKQIPKYKGQVKFDFEQNEPEEIIVAVKGTLVTIEQNIVPGHPDSFIVSYTKGTEVIQGRIPQGFIKVLGSKGASSLTPGGSSSSSSSSLSLLTLKRPRRATMNTSSGIFGMIRNPGFFNKPSTYYGDETNAYTQPFWEEIGKLPSLKLDSIKIIDTVESLIIDEDAPAFPQIASYNVLLYILFCDTWWTENSSVDHVKFREIFLKTYRVFSTPQILIQKIYQALDIPYQSFAYFNKEAFQTNIATFLTELATSSEFTSEAAKKMIKPLLSRLPIPTGKTIKLALQRNSPESQRKRSPTMIRQHRAAQAMDDITTGPKRPSPKLIIPTAKSLQQLDGVISVFTFDPQELARQICLLDYTRFARIHTREFINQAWAKSDSPTSAKNVLAMIHSSTELSLYVATTIVSQENIQKRVKICDYWIDVLANLVKFNNYHSVMAVAAGFQNNSTYRLKKTKALLSKKKLKSLDASLQFTQTTKNFLKLRQVCENSKPPCLPFIGMYLTDLTFLDDGNKNTIGSMINWRKCRKTWELIVTLLRLQVEKYHFKPFGEIQSLLKSLQTLSDDDLYAKSLGIEPRERRNHLSGR